MADFGWYRDSRHVIYTPSARDASSRLRVVYTRDTDVGDVYVLDGAFE